MPEFVRRGCCVGIRATERKHHHHHHHHHRERGENRCNPPVYMIYPMPSMGAGPMCPGPMAGAPMASGPMQGPGMCGPQGCGLNPMDFMD